MGTGTKGRFTFRSAGALFLLSGGLEVFSLTSEVPLFGALRGGPVAVAYHLAYLALFLAMGIGLWRARPWTCRLVFVGSLFYTLDKLAYLLDRKTMELDLMGQLRGHEEIWQFVDKGYILDVVTITMALFIACWWGFAFYAYARRDYFVNSGNSAISMSSTGSVGSPHKASPDHENGRWRTGA